METLAAEAGHLLAPSLARSLVSCQIPPYKFSRCTQLARIVAVIIVIDVTPTTTVSPSLEIATLSAEPVT